MKYPKMEVPFQSQGGKEGMIGDDHVAIPVTVDGASGRYGVSSADKETIAGPVLYARQTASPYKAMPFFSYGVMTDITNVTDFVCDVPDAYAKRFAVGDLVKFYDVSAGGLDTGALTSLTIDVISAAGGGTGGAGYTKITCTAEVFTNTPATNDLLVLADGTELSKNVVVISDDIDFDGSSDFAQNAYIKGAWIKGQVERTTYFVEADNQNIQLLNMV